MGKRYLVTGSQLGLLIVLDKDERRRVVEDIIRTQYIMDSIKNVEQDIKKIKDE